MPSATKKDNSKYTYMNSFLESLLQQNGDNDKQRPCGMCQDIINTI